MNPTKILIIGKMKIINNGKPTNIANTTINQISTLLEDEEVEVAVVLLLRYEEELDAPEFFPVLSSKS